jgi:predicted AAA+ superfamily ATPase
MPPAVDLPRAIAPVLRRAVREFPAVLLTGPRQSGKTTLLRALFGARGSYAALDLPETRATALADPRRFLGSLRAPAVLDEIQEAPEILPYVREAVDAERRRTGRFILTGSQNVLLAERTADSLAGRMAVLTLLPLANRELAGTVGRKLPWESAARAAKSDSDAADSAALWNRLFRGSYPEVAVNARRDAPLWHAAYLRTYLERDVRTLRNVGDLAQFQAFLRALAARSAQLVNFSDLARDLGVAVNTVKSWISVLEATHQVAVVRPYFANVGKRLVKTPKVYFTDTGLLAHLTGHRAPELAAEGPMRGAIFETAVLAELRKAYLNRGEEPEIYFYRTATGDEVDFVVERAGELVPIEVKATETPHPGMAKGIGLFRAAIGPRARRGFVVHGGGVRGPLGPDADALPFVAF